LRVFDIALAALALRASATKPQAHHKRLVPAMDEPDAAVLDRNALPQQQTALIASLWPAARQCVVRPLYEAYAAPALFGQPLRVSWPARSVADARALQAKLQAAFPRAETVPQVRHADAA